MKNLLIISSRFPHHHDTAKSVFIYSQIEELKKSFEKIMIISTTPFTPKYLTKFMKPKRRLDSMAKDYNYDNVEVHFTKNIILPNDTLKQIKGIQGYLSSIRILKKTNFKPDLIHAHFIWPSGFIAMKLNQDLKIPFIVTGHGYDVYELPLRNKYYLKMIKKILSNANHIITVSENIRDIMTKNLSVPTKKIEIISNGFSPKLFHPLDKNKVRKELSLPLDKKIVLSVGNLEEVKGHINMVKAAKQIINNRKDILFLIVGDGEERKKLKKEIEKDNLEQNFKLMGAKPHNEIALWMNACDISVIPSINEAGPAVLFEALACGKPVIGTNVGVIPEILKDNKLGIVVPPEDTNALRDSILNALENNWNVKYIQNCVKNYEWENIAKHIIKLYTRIVE